MRRRSLIVEQGGKMKKIVVQLSLLFAIMISVSGCEFLDFLNPPEPDPGIALDEVFELKIGEMARIPAASVAITFVDVLEDSRCPVDVLCPWAGNAKVLIRVEEIGRETLLIELNSTNDPREVFFGDYRIDFMALLPHQRSTVELKRDDYILSLKVAGVEEESGF